MKNKTEKQFTQSEKAKRGWWASVVFMFLIVGLIIFLTYVKILVRSDCLARLESY